MGPGVRRDDEDGVLGCLKIESVEIALDFA
jgi:hypothetical protein